MATIRFLEPGEVPTALLSNVLPAPLSVSRLSGWHYHAVSTVRRHEGNITWSKN